MTGFLHSRGAPELGLEGLVNDMHQATFFCYDLWSNPFGLELVSVLIAGALQQYQVTHIEFP
jgi:hypothetical protein